MMASWFDVYLGIGGGMQGNKLRFEVWNVA